MKRVHVQRVRECSCEAYPFCEHSSTAQTHAGLCFIIRRGLTRAYNAVLATEGRELVQSPGHVLDEIEKSISALDKLERAYKMAGVIQ